MKHARVLLVDDEVVFTSNMMKLLEYRGYFTTAVNSGDAALEALEKRHFDIVILDLKMPGLDGLATLAEIKAMDSSTEVLILTGHGAVDSALEAVKLGAYDYLAKPCQVTDLVAKIEEAWEKKDAGDRIEMEEKIKRIVESPRSVLDMMPRKKKKKKD